MKTVDNTDGTDREYLDCSNWTVFCIYCNVGRQ